MFRWLGEQFLLSFSWMGLISLYTGSFLLDKNFLSKYNLINEWVWLELWICTGWLHSSNSWTPTEVEIVYERIQRAKVTTIMTMDKKSYLFYLICTIKIMYRIVEIGTAFTSLPKWRLDAISCWSNEWSSPRTSSVVTLPLFAKFCSRVSITSSCSMFFIARSSLPVRWCPTVLGDGSAIPEQGKRRTT